MIAKADEKYNFILISRNLLKWMLKNQMYLSDLLLKYFKNIITKPMQNTVAILENLLATFADDDDCNHGQYDDITYRVANLHQHFDPEGTVYFRKPCIRSQTSRNGNLVCELKSSVT